MRTRELGLGAGTMGVLGALMGLACLDPPVLSPRDTGARDVPPGPPALVVTGLEVRGFDGRSHPREATPRRPRLRVITSAPFTGDVPLYLLAGAADEVLLDDLGSSPLRREHLERAIDCELVLEGGHLELVPRAPLEPGASYTVAIGAWAEREGVRLGAPVIWVVGVGAAPELGAEAVLAWPPDGAVDVGTEPDRLLIAFDGALASLDGIALHGAEGPLEVDRRAVDCAAYGLSGTCVALVPASALAPRTAHRLVAEGVLDGTGAPIPAFVSRFLTGPGPDTEPPRLVPLECFVDELDQDGVCVRAGDVDVAVRARVDEPVRVTLGVGHRAVAALGPRGEVELGLPHEVAEGTLGLTIRLDDLSGRRLELPTSVRAPGPLPRLVVTEVRADPLGPEPAQEYVELFNEGEVPIDLGAFVLADGFDREGDPLPAAIVPPGARVLVVADAFDPDERSDAPPVPAGVPLVRIGTSLGEAGLSAGGEPIVLRLIAEDGLVHRVSSVPAQRSPEAGACLARTEGGFVYARSACSPGTE